jgi:hypothetical protein
VLSLCLFNQGFLALLNAGPIIGRFMHRQSGRWKLAGFWFLVVRYRPLCVGQNYVQCAIFYLMESQYP